MDFGLAEFEQRLPEADTIRVLSAETMDLGDRAREIMDSVAGSWLRLAAPETYEVQGNEKVFTALNTSRAKVEALSTSTIQIDTLMQAYADSIDWLRVRMETIKVRVSDFNREYPESEKDKWDNDSVAVAARNTLASDVGRLHSDLDEAQREAAARITHITGSGRTYGETGNGLDAEVTAYGYGYSDYAGAFSGGYLSTDLPWWRDSIDFVADVREGVPLAAWEFVTDLGVLIGFQGWGNAGSAWKGMYRTAENIVILGTGIAGPQRLRQAFDEMTLVGQDLIRMDQWKSDRPGLALGGNIFDIGSLFIGGAGVAGGAAKAGAKAGAGVGAIAGAGIGAKAGSAARHLGSRFLPLEPLPVGLPEVRKLVPSLIEGGPLPVTPQPLPENAATRREGKGSPGGNDSFQDVSPRSINGAPEQQYITGIDRVHDTQAREYVLLRGQIEALEHSASPGYVHEGVFMEKVVMDAFERVMRRYPQFGGKISVRFESMP